MAAWGVLLPAFGWLWHAAVGHDARDEVSLFVSTLCGPSAAVLTSRLAMPSVVGCFGWLDRRATLAYELCWTCDCLEAPRPSAADSRRQCPFS